MIACLVVREFMAVVERRVHPELAATPLVFLRFQGKRERVYAASADTHGVETGMRVSQAQAICPEALLLPAVLTHCTRVLREVGDALTPFSDRIEVNDDFRRDLLLYVDLGKLKPRDGLLLAEQMQAACAALHLKASVGIAAGKFTASVAAQAGGIRLVSPGEEPHFLAPLPVSLLPLPREMERQLWLLGIERLGQLAALPKGAVLAQFGKQGQLLQKLASGHDGRLLQPYHWSNRERRIEVFEDPLRSFEAVEFFLSGMVQQLAQRLERSASTTEQITLLLHLERGQMVERVLQLRQPTADAATLCRALVRAVEQMPLECGVTGLELLLDLRTAEQPRQLSLFEYGEQQERQTEADVRRLAQRFGSQRFLRAVPGDTGSPQPERRFRVEPLE
jgi:nucleotidyltransferase/DNA polymerase involved in DNA repair